MKRGSHVVLVAAVLLLAACASLPPAAPVTDVGAIAGTWTGAGRTPAGVMYNATLTIKPDGSGEWTAGQQRGTLKFAVSNGQIRWESSSGRKGSSTLHVLENKRVLVSKGDDGGWSEFEATR